MKEDPNQVAKDKGAPLRKGRVLATHGLQSTVESEGETYRCVIRGALKQRVKNRKNLVVIGDFVQFETTAQGEGVIASIDERYSFLSRAEARTGQREQLIAANIDQVLVTASVHAPPLKPGLIDRYIIATRLGRMEPIVLINKIDQLSSEEEPLVDELVAAYTAIDQPFLLLSSLTGEGVDQLQGLMKDKASVFAGQSGTGKSSLINALTGLDLPVGAVVHGTRKGSHTTTTARLIPLDSGGWCIDTPGIKSFGLWNLPWREVQGYYAEIAAIGRECKYQDCAHLTEPHCAVAAAVERGEISQVRFHSYRTLLESIKTDSKHYR